jgi:hypothetical protein
VRSERPGCEPKRIENRDLARYLCTQAHSCIIHNHQKVGTTQVFIDGQINEQNVVFTHTGILFNLKEERNSNTSYNMDEH